MVTENISSDIPVYDFEKPQTEQDFFEGTFGDILRGFDTYTNIGLGDFVDDMARSAATGYYQGQVAEDASDILLRGADATEEDILSYIEANKEAQKLGPSDEMMEYQKTYEENGKGFMGVVMGLYKSGFQVIPEVILSSVISMATNKDSLVAAGTVLGGGILTGAGTGAVAGGVGAVPGAIAGAAASVPYAFAAAGSVLEMGATFSELLQEEIEGELTPEKIRKALDDDKIYTSLRNKALARGVTIGVIDAFTGKLGGKVAGKILSNAATKGTKIKSVLAASGIESVGGSVGEATARGVIGQEMDISEIALEGIAEAPGGIKDVISARFSKPKYKVNGKKVDAATIDNLIETMTLDQLQSTKIKIDNDYEGRGKKLSDRVLELNTERLILEANPDINPETLSEITRLQLELSSLEGNKTEVAKEKASILKSKIKDLQENQLETEVATEADAFNEIEQDEQIKYIEQAGKELIQESEARGDEEFEITEQQNLERAVELFNKDQQTETEAVDETSTEIVIEDPSKGYSFEYESEQDIPIELKNVEPNSKSVTEVNGKKKIRLTFSGQKLIDAGLGKLKTETTPEVETEVDDEVVYEMNKTNKKTWSKDFEILDNRQGQEEALFDEEGNKTSDKWWVVNKVTGQIIEVGTKEMANDVIANAPAYAETFGDGTKVEPNMIINPAPATKAEVKAEPEAEVSNQMTPKEIVNERFESIKARNEAERKGDNAEVEKQNKRREYLDSLLDEKIKNRLAIQSNLYSKDAVNKEIEELKNDPLSELNFYTERINLLEEVLEEYNKIEALETKKQSTKDTAALEDLDNQIEEAKQKIESYRKFDKISVDPAPKAEVKVEPKTEQEIKARINELEEVPSGMNAVMQAAKEGKPTNTPEIIAMQQAEISAKEEIESLKEKLKQPKTDPEISRLENEIETEQGDIETLQEEITNEKYNFREDVARIKEEKAKIRKDKKLSKDQKIEAIEEKISEQQDLKQEMDSMIESYTDDIKQKQSEIRKANKALEKITQKPRKQVTKVEQQVDNAKKALNKLDKDIKIVIHNDDSSYRKATGEDNRGQSTRGEYNPRTKTIHINATKVQANTVAHEVFHALLLRSGITNKQAKAITDRMLKAVKKTASPELLQKLKEHSENYESALQSEESIAELFGILASEYKSLDKPTQTLVQKWINKLAKILGVNKFTDAEVIDLLNVVSAKVEAGQEITEQDVVILDKNKSKKEIIKSRKQTFSKASSVEMFENPDILQPKREANGRTKVIELGKAFDKRAKDNGYYIPIPKDGVYTDAQLNAIAEAMTDDAQLQLLQDDSGIGWYDLKTRSAMELMSRIHPELSDSNSKPHLEFTLMVALISQNNSVGINFRQANEAYTYYKNNNKLPNKPYAGKSGNIIKQNIALAFEAIKKKGWENYKNILQETKTVKEWEAEGYKVNGENKTTEITGAMAMLGSKIGSFWGNLNGDFNTLTADLWFSRMFNRYTGNVVSKKGSEKSKQNTLDELKKYNGKTLLNGYKKSDILKGTEVFDKWLNTIVKDYADGGYKDKQTLNIVSNTHFKNVKGELQDIPRGGKERNTMRDVVKRVQDKLIERGYPKLDIADIQAIVWYNEKDLYRQYKAVNKSSEKTDYETAAQEVLREQGVNAEVALPFKRSKSSTDGGRKQTDRIQPKSLSEKVEDAPQSRKQKTIQQAARDFNMSETGFFPPNADSYFLKRAISKAEGDYGIKKARTGSFFLVDGKGKIVKDLFKRPQSRKQKPSKKPAQKRTSSIKKAITDIKNVLDITPDEQRKIFTALNDQKKNAKDIKKDIVASLRELTKEGKITPSKMVSVINKVPDDFNNPITVERFVEYMTKVFNNADYGNKMTIANAKKGKAKKNASTKIGIAEGLVEQLQRLFSVKPSLIPDSVLDQYMSLIDMFGKREAVLSLPSIKEVTQMTEDVLQQLDEEQSMAIELADRFDAAEKVMGENGVDYAATIKEMLDNEVITDREYEVMKKYKSEINPPVPETPKTEAEIEAERQETIENIKETKEIDPSVLPSRLERDDAKELKKLLKTDAVEGLSLDDLKNLFKVIDNINSGYLPHYAKIMISKMTAINDAKVGANAIKRSKLLPLSKIYANLKSKITKKAGTSELVRRNPTFYIDQVFGDFKTQDIFNSIFKRSAEASASYTKDIKEIQAKIEKAEQSVLKSFNRNPNKTQASKYKQMSYLIQQEFLSNPESNQVNSVEDFLKSTIKRINQETTSYTDNDAKMLQEILDTYTENGTKTFDNVALYESFNVAERNSIRTLEEINKSLTERAVYTANIIRGNKITPLKNYTHLSVIPDVAKGDIVETETSMISDMFNKYLKPSTKAKSLIQRTGKASPLNFDVYSSVQRGSKYTLMDFHLTDPIRTARRTLNEIEKSLSDKDGNMPTDARRKFNAIRDASVESIENLLSNSLTQSTTGDQVIDYIQKQGYRAILAGIPRASYELLSNVLAGIIIDPKGFATGIKLRKIIGTPSAKDIMNNLNSTQTNRVFSTGLSGKFVDTGILNQAAGVTASKAKGKVKNTILQLWNNSGQRWIKGVEFTSDTLISSPDKLVMQPMWFGSFENRFKQITGTSPDFDKIAANDEAYMDKYSSALKEAKTLADNNSVAMGATDNSFMGILKGTVKPNQGVSLRVFNAFNGFMTRFLIFEYMTARTGIMAAMGSGQVSKKQGVALLAGVTTRMVAYTFLGSLVAESIKSLTDDDDEDFDLSQIQYEDDDAEGMKSIDKMLGQAMTSAFTSLLFGRDFGNATKSIINYGLEELNENYGQFLRDGDYDKYRDAIQYTLIPEGRSGKSPQFMDVAKNLFAAYTPMLKTLEFGVNKIFETDRVEPDAIERQQDERFIRLPLEVLGVAGFIPFYKDIRKIVLANMYKGLRKAKKDAANKKKRKEEVLQGYSSETDMKRYDFPLWERTFGPDSPGYDKRQAEKELRRKERKLKQLEKDQMYDYTPPSSTRKQKSSSPFGAASGGGKSSPFGG